MADSDEAGPPLRTATISADDLPRILRVLGTLGDRLRGNHDRIQLARAQSDEAKVRAGVAWVHFEIKTALSELYGEEVLWALDQTMAALEYAINDSRHELMRTSKDPTHKRQDSPEQVMIKVTAAALLDQACSKGKEGKSRYAKQIGAAIAKGGYASPSVRTVETWSSDLATIKQLENSRREGALHHSLAPAIYQTACNVFSERVEKIGFAQAWKDALATLQANSRAAVENSLLGPHSQVSG